MSTIPSHANIIQRALLSENSTAEFWTEHLTADLHKVLIESGMKSVGVKPHPVNSEADPYFWTVFAIEDRALAQAAIQPYRSAPAPIEFQLSPVEQEHYWAEYKCPSCGGADVKLTDGDSIAVSVLPEGIESFGEIDPGLMVGTCKSCEQGLYVYEFGFSTVEYPDGDFVFCVSNIDPEPAKFQMYRAEAPGHSPWLVSRRWYANGPDIELPKGPFVVDFHQVGPFKLDTPTELSGRHGVASCGGAGNNSKWRVGADMLRNLALTAKQKLSEGAKA